MSLEISVWGARGSVSVCLDDMREVGTNTPCVMARANDRVVIFDAGNGIIMLGDKLQREGVKRIDLFLSHAHYDHIFGLPFFAPLFNRDIDVTIYSAGAEQLDTKALIAKFMSEPFFPVSNEIFNQSTRYKTFVAGDTINLGDDILVRTAILNHPGRTIGYRLECDERSFCYASDFEHDDGPKDTILSDFMENADLAFVDASYTPEEYEAARGFGHAHWRACGEICRRAGVKSWRLFHHQYMRTDKEIAAIEAEAKAVFPNASAAREGDVIVL